MSNIVFGNATVRVDGEELLINQDAKANLGGKQRNTVKGTKIHGYTEEAMEPFVEVQASISRDTGPEDWNRITDATVVFEMDSGQVYAFSNCWQANPVDITGGDGGRVPLRFVSATEPKRIR